jgi:anti-repressor protein
MLNKLRNLVTGNTEHGGLVVNNKEVVFEQDGQVVTDSLLIAEMFSKSHGDVLKDIRKQMEYTGEEFSQGNFSLRDYDNRGKLYPKYILSEDAFTLVVMSYNTREAVQMKLKFIQEFRRMKEFIQNINAPSYMIGDPVKRAQKWIEEQQEKEALQLVMQEQAPKIDYHDAVLNPAAKKKLLTPTDIATDLGTNARRLNELLENLGVQYRKKNRNNEKFGHWIVSSNFSFLIEDGYCDYKITEYGQQLKWTEKGRKWIIEQVKGGVVNV